MSQCGISEKIQFRLIERLTEYKASLISFEKNRVVKYLCSCGNEAQSCSSNILKPKWKGCIKCANQKRGNFNTFEYAKKIFEEGGITLPPQEYKGNKIKLHYPCPVCKEQALVSLSEFKRGRRCEQCSKQRAKITNLEKYGVENTFQAEVCKAKTKITNLLKYGVEHHMQNVEISEKSLHNTMKGKTYIFPSGRKEHCQGYEPRCLDILLDTYDEVDLLVQRKQMPQIWYKNPCRDNKPSIYFPDIFIPSHNIVIEVKSVYTMEKDKQINLAKFNGVVKAGYELHLYVFNHKSLLYQKIFTTTSITVIPHPPAVLEFID